MFRILVLWENLVLAKSREPTGNTTISHYRLIYGTMRKRHKIQWKLNRANWDLFNTLCTGKLIPENFKESSDPISDFTSSLIEISKECIPQTSTNPTKSNSWYSDDCKEAIKQRKQALSKFKKSPNSNNLNDVKVFRAKARRTIKISKRKSWKSYVSKINHKTPIKKVWDMIRKISGKNKSPSYTHLNMVGTDSKATSKTDIADTLGETFCHNSSSFITLNPSERLKPNKRKLNWILNHKIMKFITKILI